MFTFVHFAGTSRGRCTFLLGGGGVVARGEDVAGQEYFNRQAATLLKYAKAVADPEVAAGLVEKAADLKEQAERPRDDAGDEAPDAAGG